MTTRLFTRPFVLLCAQLLAISTIVALFFPLQLYLASLGIPEHMAGFIIGADALAALIVQPLITPWVAARTARRWLLAGCALLAAALLAEGTVTQAGAFTAARLLQGAGFICIMTALMPLLVLCIPREKSGRAFGWISMIRLVPYAAVPPLFGMLDIAPDDLGFVIRWSALLAVIPALLLAFLPAFAQEAAPPAAAPLSSIRQSLQDRSLRRLLAATLLVYAAYAITFFFIKGLTAHAGLAGSGLFFTLATLVMIVVRLVGGPLFDRYDKTRMGAAALVLSAAATAGLPLCATTTALLIVAVLCGLGWGVGMPLINAIAFAISPPAAQGLNQNLVFLMLQGGFFLGPLLGGVLLDHMGYAPVFAAAGLLMLLAALLVFKVEQHQ
jgi:MFS family permease